jgi:DNA primase
MDILDLLRDSGIDPKRKASTHGGEFCSPCPFCRDGNDRFLTWPNRCNKDGTNNGGRFSCRVCGKYGDGITFLMTLHDMGYKEACSQLQITPKQRSNSALPRPEPKLLVANEPPAVWQEKAKSFAEWSHAQLLGNNEGLALLKERGFNDESIARFRLGFNPRTFFRERPDWELSCELKENGKARKLWLPAGIVIPSFSADQVIKVKIRRSDWKEGDEWPKYVEVSGSKQTPSIFGNTALSCALIVESEIDGLIVQQEAADLLFCVALGGSTKPLDVKTDELLRTTNLILFLPDFDEAGASAWVKWKKKFPSIQRVLTPFEKSAGDYFQNGGNLRGWLEESIKEIQRKLKETKTCN